MSHTTPEKTADKARVKRISVKALAVAFSALTLCAALIVVSVFWGKFTPVEAADVCIGTQTGCMASITGGAGRYFVGTDDLVTDVPSDGSEDITDTTDLPDESPDDSVYLPVSSGRFTVTFEFHGRESISCSMATPATVGEIADKLGIALNDFEVSNIPFDTVISSDTVITTDTVTYSIMTESTAIPYKTKYVETDKLYVGNSRTSQYGINGESITEYEIKYVNGVEVSKTKVRTYVSREAQDQIIEKGTKVYVPPAPPVSKPNPGTSGITNVKGDANGGTFVGGDGKTYKYSYYIDVTATMYYAGGNAATGVPADENVIAVDPTVIPLGTKVYVTGSYADIGYRSCEDVGGGIKGNHIDVCFNPGNYLAPNFGFRHMRVYILE